MSPPRPYLLYLLTFLISRIGTNTIAYPPARTARDLLSALVSDGILGSDSPKGPVSLRFPLDAVEVLFPSLFPES